MNLVNLRVLPKCRDNAQRNCAQALSEPFIPIDLGSCRKQLGGGSEQGARYSESSLIAAASLGCVSSEVLRRSSACSTTGGCGSGQDPCSLPAPQGLWQSWNSSGYPKLPSSDCRPPGDVVPGPVRGHLSEPTPAGCSLHLAEFGSNLQTAGEKGPQTWV